MKFIFAEKKMEASPDLRGYAERKVGKIEKFFKKDTETEAFVTFSTERGRGRVEVTLNNAGMFYRASVATGDMYASIDAACSNIEGQIRKNKTRLAKRLRDGAFELKPMTPTEAPASEEEEFQVVRTKRFSIKPMTTEEAILQMNLLEHEFYVFRNTDDDDSFAVVYRRRQGGYGLISSADD